MYFVYYNIIFWLDYAILNDNIILTTAAARSVFGTNTRPAYWLSINVIRDGTEISILFIFRSYGTRGVRIRRDIVFIIIITNFFFPTFSSGKRIVVSKNIDENGL